MGETTNNFNGVWIELERCIDCASHEYCTRHIEAKYQQYETQISSLIDAKVPRNCPYKFVCNPGPKSHGINCKKSDYNPYMYAAYTMNPNTRRWHQSQVFRYPRIGGFEIFVNKGKIRKEVFSKLRVCKWPNPQWVVDKILNAVESMGGWQPLPTLSQNDKPKRKYAGVGGSSEVTDLELRELMKRKFCTLLAAFKSFDKNGDGAVNRKEFGVGLKSSGVDLPPKIVDRIWAMADVEGNGNLTYQQFARKFAAYRASPALTAGSSGGGGGSVGRQPTVGKMKTVQSPQQENLNTTFKIDEEDFNADAKDEEELTVAQIARRTDLMSRDVEQLGPDELRAFLIQKHGNLLVAFRSLTVNSNDFKLDYSDFMQRFPQVLGRQISALKMNELWRTMDADFSGYIELSEFTSNKCLSNTAAGVLQLKGRDATPEMALQFDKKPTVRPDSAASSNATTKAPDTRPVSAMSNAAPGGRVIDNNLTTVTDSSDKYDDDFEKKSSTEENMN